jgi:hypothetical protein
VYCMSVTVDMHISTVAVAPIGIARRQLWVCVDLLKLGNNFLQIVAFRIITANTLP